MPRTTTTAIKINTPKGSTPKFGVMLNKSDSGADSIRPIDEAKSEVPDFVTPFEVVPGKTYYAVKVTYSSGDSNGRTSGHVDYVDVFETVKCANACAEVVGRDNENTNQRKGGTAFSYRDESGAAHSVDYKPWSGYFERLENLEVTPIVAMQAEPLFNYRDFQHQIWQEQTKPVVKNTAQTKPAIKKNKPR